MMSISLRRYSSSNSAFVFVPPVFIFKFGGHLQPTAEVLLGRLQAPAGVLRRSSSSFRGYFCCQGALRQSLQERISKSVSGKSRDEISLKLCTSTGRRSCSLVLSG